MKTKGLLSLAVLIFAALACSIGGDPGVLFEDDFSSTSDRWAQQTDSDGITDYYQDSYRIKVDLENWYFWTNPGENFTDTRIEVDMTKIGGPEPNEYGVMCRFVDDFNYYFFTLSSDGYYSIAKYVDDNFSNLGTEAPEFSDAINLGETTNKLRADCVGSTLSLYANGQLLLQTTDTSFSSGDVGLVVGSFDEPGVDILFDNLIVRDPNVEPSE